jgi:hypothetical protein
LCLRGGTFTQNLGGIWDTFSEVPGQGFLETWPSFDQTHGSFTEHIDGLTTFRPFGQIVNGNPFDQSGTFVQDAYFLETSPFVETSDPFNEAAGFNQTVPFDDTSPFDDVAPFFETEPFDEATPFEEASPFGEGEGGGGGGGGGGICDELPDGCIEPE